MKYVISGTNRPKSRSREVANLIQEIYADNGESVEIIDLAELGLHELDGSQYGGASLPLKLASALEKINQSEGLIIVVPEYNGSMPGALKYFIDHWKYPDSFEHRPVCLVGLGGLFGGLRPVEHLQGVLGYRNAFIFPIRVFLINVWTILKAGKLSEPVALGLLKDQVLGFQKFVFALGQVGLDANTLNAKRAGKSSAPI